MLVKFDNQNDNLIYDFIQKKFLQGKESHAYIGKRKGVIPFTSSISIKKLRPNTKVNKKFGDSWLSTQKLSLAYILAGLLLKGNKTRLAGFLKKTDKNYIFLEISIVAGAVSASYRWITDTPQDFLAIEGKSYDIIIGDPEVATEMVDWSKLWKVYSKDIKPLQMIIASITIFSLMIGTMYMFGVIGGKKKGPSKTGTAAPEKIPPLSAGEIKILSILVTQEILQEYKIYVDSLEDTPDIAMRSATIQIKNSELNVTGVLSMVYESIYPYPSSTKQGDFYTMKVDKSISKKRQDISKASPVIDAVKANRMDALSALIDAGDVAAREESGWKFSVIIEKNYGATVKMLNAIYFSPVVVNSLTIDESSTRGELFLHNL